MGRAGVGVRLVGEVSTFEARSSYRGSRVQHALVGWVQLGALCQTLEATVTLTSPALYLADNRVQGVLTQVATQRG